MALPAPTARIAQRPALAPVCAVLAIAKQTHGMSTLPLPSRSPDVELFLPATYTFLKLEFDTTKIYKTAFANGVNLKYPTKFEMVEARYVSILTLQCLMILADLAINTAAPLLHAYNTVQLVLYVLQDTCTVMAVIVLFLTFFSTYVFQAGLISVLVIKFRATIIMLLLYLTLSITYHVLSLRERWHHPFKYTWSPGLIGLYVVQRIAAVFHYHLYKRTALMLGDQRYYQDSAWLRKELDKRR